MKRRLGTRIRTLRLDRRVTQEQLAARADLSYKFLGEIERGLADPGLDSLVAVARALSVDVGDLLEG